MTTTRGEALVRAICDPPTRPGTMGPLDRALRLAREALAAEHAALYADHSNREAYWSQQAQRERAARVKSALWTLVDATEAHLAEQSAWERRVYAEGVHADDEYRGV